MMSLSHEKKGKRVSIRRRRDALTCVTVDDVCLCTRGCHSLKIWWMGVPDYQSRSPRVKVLNVCRAIWTPSLFTLGWAMYALAALGYSACCATVSCNTATLLVTETRPLHFEFPFSHTALARYVGPGPDRSRYRTDGDAVAENGGGDVSRTLSCCRRRHITRGASTCCTWWTSGPRGRVIDVLLYLSARMLRRAVVRERVRSCYAFRGRLPTVNHGCRRGQSGASMNDGGHAPPPMAAAALRPRPAGRKGY